MKRILVFALCFMMFVSSAFAGNETFISPDYFNSMFNLSCLLTGSGHKITSYNVKFETGTVKDCFIIKLANGFIELHLYMPHIEYYEGKMNDIDEIDLWFYSDGTVESIRHLTFAIMELAMTTGAVKSIEEANDFITKLGFLENVKDGAENTLIINGLKYQYLLSSFLGFHFSIVKA